MADVDASEARLSLSVPSEKEKKYDRQLRLWAASGQAALESANILLMNSGSGTVGVETLKNLVLPGIGKFTIVDDAIVTESDLGVNFFLDETFLGKSRAQSCTELLLELNFEVQGQWYPRNSDAMDIHHVLSSQSPYTVILYTLPIQPDHLQALEVYSQAHRTPLIAIHSAGFFSYFTIRLPGIYPIVDTHPDATSTTDLRLLAPWLELEAFAEEMTKDIDSLDNHKHGHLPFVVILLHFIKKWKASHNGVAPSSYSEKVAFRKLVADATRTDNAEGGEENFEEAVAAVLKTISPPSLPTPLKEVFEHTPADETEARSSFWVIAAALREFYERHQCLPVPGGLPDMKAESGVYIKLQNIYKDKARKDAAEVLDLARQRPGGEVVDPADVDLFCKNAAFVKLIVPTTSGRDQLRRVAREEISNDEMAKDSVMPFSLLPVYLALRATSHKSTATRDDILEDVQAILPEINHSDRLVQAASEVSRAAGGELHNISAVTGGMVAQETIKIITNQYVPIENTCIFDGIGSRCQVLRL
ncbi:ThiF family protein [Colletotrichum musicola]|uniref:NEDD8-activating enzyme E1 regulatory subunit n=1 Tax=Colletotrichum musicola TaxID=2175873 RepID=A0A8H6N784_9PEZI|nr:ThiF family protein [Colletotrichum musicola]